ncbi:MAG TPA: nitrate reductase associated protein [Leptolyngbyaceae cyanobacterium M33_DOE_097]|uniref:Nitrate reductase associated protein n=1 Tax=Oscillatoriales cyanobacterium SpSt-418 TaxID=2282169 RepID=A0A7C3KCU8_9CYAN|nr:nitrate reductase associated protein [Leptolyngbyaceae cyanobacterium M33_DOE_097]
MVKSTSFFLFEADFVDSLRCIPMQVRLKLDVCGIKLKLPQWHQFSDRERQLLVDLPCNSTAEIQHYRDTLKQLVYDRTGENATELAVDPAPEWKNSAVIAESVLQKAESFGITLHLDQWEKMTEDQRFALLKLSRSNHENRNFLPALREFQVI